MLLQRNNKKMMMMMMMIHRCDLRFNGYMRVLCFDVMTENSQVA